MTTTQIGECGELIVSVDLFRRGYEVFKALNSFCSCDLIAMKGGRLLRVQVKVGSNYLPTTNAERNNFDVLAVVHSFGGKAQRIEYFGKDKELACEL